MKKAIMNTNSSFSKGEYQKAKKTLQKHKLQGQTVCKKILLIKFIYKNSCFRTVFYFLFYRIHYENYYIQISTQ